MCLPKRIIVDISTQELSRAEKKPCDRFLLTFSTIKVRFWWTIGRRPCRRVNSRGTWLVRMSWNRAQCGTVDGIALTVGLTHDFWNCYWASSGAWKLDAVGRCYQLYKSFQALFALIGLAVVKTTAALIPSAVEYCKLRTRRFWRLIC